MSLGDATVDVRLDSAQAETQLRDLLSRIASAQAEVVAMVDAGEVAPTIENAVQAAEAEIDATADAGDVTSSIDSAVEAADAEVDADADAAQVTSSIDSAVDAANDLIEATADAAGVTSAIDSAVDASDSQVDADADASDVTSSINAAVEAADNAVEVEAQADDITATLNAAIGAAENVIIVNVQADSAPVDAVTSSLDEAEGAADELGDSSDAAGDALNRLRRIAATLGLAVLFKDTVTEVEALNSAVAITEQLIKQTGGTAGFTAQQFRDVAGDLALALGESQIEVLRTQNILQTFRQVSGDVFTEATEIAFDMAAVLGSDATGAALQLGIALNDPVQGVTRLRRAGVQLTQQQRDQIQAFVDTGDITSAQNVILGELRTQLGGAARASADTTAQLGEAGRVVQRQFGAALVEVIDRLGPALIDTLLSLGPTAEDAGERFGQALAAVLELAVELAPAVGSISLALAELAPIIELTADVVKEIPDPAIQLGGALFLISRGARAAGRGLRFMTAANVIGGLLLLVDLARDLPVVGTGLEDVAFSAEQLETDLSKLNRTNELTGQLAEILGDDFSRLDTLLSQADGVSGTERIFRAFNITGRTASQVTGDARKELEELDSILAQLVGSRPELVFNLLREGARESGRSVGELRAEFPQLNQAIEAQEEQARAAGVEVRNLADVEDFLSEETRLATEAQEQQAEALRSIRSEAPEVSGALRDLMVPVGDVLDEIVRFAQSVDAAALSEEQLEAVAKELGVEMDALGPAIDEVIAPLQGLKSTAEGAVPGFDDIAGQVEDLEELTLPKLRTTLGDMFDDLKNFNDNLALVAEEAPLLTGLAAQAPEIAAVIAGAIRDGKTGAIDEFELLAVGLQQQMQRQPGIIDAAAPGVIGAMGDVGLLSVERFRETFRPDRPAGFRTGQARSTIDSFAGPFRLSGGSLANQAVNAFDRRAQALRDAAGRRTEQARSTIDSFAGPFGIAGRDIAGRTVSAADNRLANLRNVARNQTRAARNTIDSFAAPFRRSGRGLGTETGQGLRSGMRAEADNRQALIDVRNKWIGGLRKVFGAQSPAREMIPVGRDVMRGFMLGFADEADNLQQFFQQFPQLFAVLGTSANFGSGVERWRGLALQALAFTGQPLTWINSLMRRMNQESGGNPGAINLTDINAMLGDPSRGLMQTIGATFNAFAGELRGRGIFDPFANIVAAIRYTVARYGSGPAGWDRPGGYQAGTGFVPRDDVFMLHRGEIVFPPEVSRFFRREGLPIGGQQQTAFVVEQLIIQVPPGITQPTVFGRNVARGFERSLRERSIRVDARIGG